MVRPGIRAVKPMQLRQPLAYLPLGARFRLAMNGGRTGTLLSLSSGGARVRYDQALPHNLGDGTSLARPAETLTISPNTEVIAL